MFNVGTGEVKVASKKDDLIQHQGTQTSEKLMGTTTLECKYSETSNFQIPLPQIWLDTAKEGRFLLAHNRKLNTPPLSALNVQ